MVAWLGIHLKIPEDRITRSCDSNAQCGLDATNHNDQETCFNTMLPFL